MIQQIPNALSMDFVVNRIMMRLGASSRRVVLEEVDVAQVIANETLPTYSKYFPHEHVEHLRKELRVPGKTGEYYVDPPYPVLSASRVVGGGNQVGIGQGNFRGADDDIYIGRGAVSGLLDAMDLGNLMGAASLPVTVRFFPPRTVEIYPRSDYDGQAVVLNCVHPITLHTIGWNMADYFSDLALQDTYIALKAILKKFQNISTVYGEINLNLEEMEGAEDRRKELLDLFRTKSPFRANRKKWYVG